MNQKLNHYFSHSKLKVRYQILYRNQLYLIRFDWKLHLVRLIGNWIEWILQGIITKDADKNYKELECATMTYNNTSH